MIHARPGAAASRPPEKRRNPPPLLTMGFRPFFVAAGLFAVAAMAMWMAAYFLTASMQNYYHPVIWHGHEMLLGYTGAVIAGFLLTAVRNWTSLTTASGPALAALVLLWLLGRVSPLLPVPPVVSATVDFAFLPALAFSLLVPLLRSGQTRNLVFVPVLLLMGLSNAAVHAEQLGLLRGTAAVGLQATLYLILLLMTVIGGRVIPFFTSRALPGCAPRRRPWLDVLALASLLLLSACILAKAPPVLSTPAAALSACLHLARLLGWYDHRIWSQPLLWVLYLGYAWLVMGLSLTAFGTFGLVPANAATHAFTTGAIGVMTLGMMVRVTLGHTGRPLEPSLPIVAAFVFINLAAVSRVLLPLLLPDLNPLWIVVAGSLWCLAYMVFLIVHVPMLYRRRVDQPGP